MRSLPAALLIFAFSTIAHAGFIEIGASGNFKRVNLTDDVVDSQTAITGSLSYYFTEMSALELSYTDGQQRSEIRSGGVPFQTISVDYTMLGLDFILSLGAREAVLRPYIKGGAAYIVNKRRTDTHHFNPADSTISEEDPALVPSGGLGFRFLMTKNLSLKAGIDFWSSKPLSENNVKTDYAGRLGLSWMF